MSFDFSPLVPDAFAEEFSCHWQRFAEAIGEEGRTLVDGMLQSDAELAAQWVKAWVGSRFIADYAITQHEAFMTLLQSGQLARSYESGEVAAALAKACEHFNDCSDDNDYAQLIRRFRNVEQVRIIWRDLNRLATMEETVADASALADAAIRQTVDFIYPCCCRDYGTPIGRDSGRPQKLVVLAMGKLGAGELNVSSDIDLIFCYEESGQTEGAKRSLANQDFFIRMGQRLIKLLDQRTVDGFVYRVDMRLRPYGNSGALALSFDAMEDYYQTQGRDWERYAMIKARIVAGDDASSTKFANMLRPFTYRRYIDFGAIEALRDMKGMIAREVRRKGMQDDVKLGAGGIREVEFIAQSFQLIRGGREQEFQQRELKQILQLLKEREYMEADKVDGLWTAYELLRNLEHGVQGFADQQTQKLPVDELDRERLAWVQGFADWDSLWQQLEQHREHVSLCFQDVVAAPEDEAGCGDEDSQWVALWLGEIEEEALADCGFDDPETVATRLCQLRESRPLRLMSAEGRARLDSFMPRLLATVAATEQPALTLERTLKLVEAVLRRTAYLVLLIENPGALFQLVRLCAASPWIANQLATMPTLLDELLNEALLYQPPGKRQLEDELRQQMLRIEVDDLEQQMEGLRYFRMAHALRVAASEVSGSLPLMKVSDYLTDIAQTVLEYVLDIAWQQMVDKYGYPQRAKDEPCGNEFIIIGYGKMGGIELGHNSDLDLVFIHDVPGNQSTNGERSVANTVFFTRLGQRIIHILNTQTPLGQLYEVDMRLRPSGNSGMLVSSLAAFQQYQEKEAWTWEHQALVRARVVAGSPELAQRFFDLRCEILSQQRESQKLMEDVIAMREKMADSLGSKPKSGMFHLKQDRGGIVDIEFMVQYAVLAWSHCAPALLEWTDNIRILEALQKQGLVAEDAVEQLIEAYKTYRAMGHRLSLQQAGGEVVDSEYCQEREQVQAIWKQLLGQSR